MRPFIANFSADPCLAYSHQVFPLLNPSTRKELVFIAAQLSRCRLARPDTCAMGLINSFAARSSESKVQNQSSKRKRRSSYILKASAADPEFVEPWSIYDSPLVYEGAFIRDYESQVRFIEEVYKELISETATSFLDVGCGPANHAVLLAKQGHTVFALDSNPSMLAHARQKADAEGVSVKFLKEDMQEFSVPGSKQVDVALLLCNTMAHLHSNHDARECLTCIFEALKPGGLLMIELPSIQEIFDGSIADGTYWENALEGQENVMLITEYGTDDDEFDPESQVLRKRIGVSIRRGDDIDLIGEQFVWQRTYTYQEIALLADLCGFQLVAAYGDFDEDIDMDHPDQSRFIACLQRPETDDEDFLGSLS